MAGQHVSERIEYLAHLRRLASEGSEADETLPALRTGLFHSTAPGAAKTGQAYREYVSDPANPVPYRQRPISPTYPGGDWRTWEVADQRFVDHRPDVLSFVSEPLDHDLTVTGPLAANLFASTSGTDSDFVVKLIDVYPQDAQKNAWNPEEGPKPGQYAQSLNGYELPIAMEVRRGRYLASYEKPHPLTPNKPTEWNIPLRDHDHVFLKGHRIMVQIQSTWFPVIDRNPQKFVPSIYQATASDFVLGDAAHLLLARSAFVIWCCRSCPKTKKVQDRVVIPSGAKPFAKREILRSRGTCCLGPDLVRSISRRRCRAVPSHDANCGSCCDLKSMQLLMRSIDCL